MIKILDNKRIIKNEKESLSFKNINIKSIPPNSELIHPVTLHNVINNEDVPICLTKLHIKNNKINFFNKYNCSDNNYNSYMHIPPVGLSASDLLNIYKISSVNDLISWIDINTNLFTINRGINAWIRVNYDTLKFHNNILEDIFIKLFNRYKNNLDLNKIDIEKEIKYYIEYWIFNNSDNKFTIDLYNDMIKYLIKKNKK